MDCILLRILAIVVNSYVRLITAEKVKVFCIMDISAELVENGRSNLNRLDQPQHG